MTLAPPLIALPGISPRRKTLGSSRRAFLSTMVDGEIVDYSVLLPVYGEKMAVAR
ncbi:hypothetical protein ACWTU6_25585 [Mesorhizobium sp. BHbsci]